MRGLSLIKVTGPIDVETWERWGLGSFVQGKGTEKFHVRDLSAQTILSYIRAQDLALHHASLLNLYF